MVSTCGSFAVFSRSGCQGSKASLNRTLSTLLTHLTPLSPPLYPSVQHRRAVEDSRATVGEELRRAANVASVTRAAEEERQERVAAGEFLGLI